MGATNFRPHNASKCFVVLENEERKYWECPDCNERHYEWGHDECPEKCEGCGASGEDMEEKVEISQPDEDDLLHLYEYLDKCFADVEKNPTNDLEYIKRWDNDRLKICNDKVLGELYITKSFGETDYRISLNITLQVGYYEAAILDYSFDWEGHRPSHNGDYYFDDDEVMEVMDDYEDYINCHYANAGMGHLQRKNFESWVKTAVSQLEQTAEAVFEKVAPTKAVILGTMSNGVSIYEVE